MTALSLLLGAAACAADGDEVTPDGQGAVAPRSAGPHESGPSPASSQFEADSLAVREVQTGLASWYGEPFHGRATASGEIFDKAALSAAHPTWPLGSLARVTRVETGSAVLVRINDRGPFVDGRIIDLSRAAAEALGFLDDGLAEVRVELLGPADPQDRAARARILDQD